MFSTKYQYYIYIQIDWNYEHQGKWGQESITCTSGRSQSPINLEVHLSYYDSSLNRLTVNQEDLDYSWINKMTLTNYGHSC